MLPPYQLTVLVLNAVVNIISVMPPIHAFLEFHFNSTPQKILSKPLAAFPHNHHENSGQHPITFKYHYLSYILIC